MIHIFSICTNERKTEKLKQSAERYGCNINIMCFKEWRSNTHKIIYMLQILQNIDDNDVTCFVDAYDVIACQSDSLILQRFLEMDCHFLISVEKNCYPEKYKNKLLRIGSPFLNSGGIIGYCHKLKEILEKISISLEGISDQGLFIKYYLQNYRDPTIKLDVDSRIFRSMYLTEVKRLSIDANGNIRFSSETECETPCFIHFNGRSYRSNGRNIMSDLINYEGIFSPSHLSEQILVSPEI